MTGRMFTGNQTEKAGNLADILYLAPITQPRHRVGGSNPAHSGKAGEQTDRLSELWVVVTELTNPLLHYGRGIEMEVQRTNQVIQFKPHFAGTRQCAQPVDCPRVPMTTGLGKIYPLVKKQRFNAAFGSRQLPSLGITQLHQVPQLAITASGHVDPSQFSPTQPHRKVLTVEAIRFHSLSWLGWYHRGRYHQTRVLARYQLVIQAKSRGAGLINKRDPFPRKMFVHVVKQMRRTIGQPQRLEQCTW